MTSTLPPDPYKSLGVAKDTQVPEIRSAHRKLVLRCHPDKVQDPALKAVKEDEFQKVQQAYMLLSDDTKRQQYDDQIRLFELRKEMRRGDPTLRSNPFEYEVKTAEPRATSYTRYAPNVHKYAAAAPRSYEILHDEPMRHTLRKLTSCESAEVWSWKRLIPRVGEHEREARPWKYEKEGERIRDGEKIRDVQTRKIRFIETAEPPSNTASQSKPSQPSPKVYSRSRRIEEGYESIAPSQDAPSRRFCRGRGAHQVVGVNGSDDPNDPDFFVRDIEFRSPNGSPSLARCRLDSACEVPLLVSEHWARENDKWHAVSSDFRDPGVQSVSGHKMQINGILRNMVFNLKGSTVTYRRDVYVCPQLNTWADMVFGAKFMAEQFAVLFSKAKKIFAGIFGFRKEKAEEKARGQALQDDADRQAAEQERKRRARKEKEAREREEARLRAWEEHQRRQNGQQVPGR